MSPDKPHLNILIALMSEARPIIDHYRLMPEKIRGLTIYRAAHKGAVLNLLVTGIGRIPMATHVGWLAGACPVNRVAWLNIGAAGHRSLPTGTVVRVAHCEQVFGERAFYPPLVAPWSGALGSLLTSDRATSDYPDQSLVDMEGAAFFAAALTFSPAELVQSLKIVSDNATTGLSQLDGPALTAYVEQNLASIADFVQAMSELASTQPEINETLSAFLTSMECVRMSASQRVILHELSQQLSNIGVPLQRFERTTLNKKGVADLLADMRAVLQKTAPELT